LNSNGFDSPNKEDEKSIDDDNNIKKSNKEKNVLIKKDPYETDDEEEEALPKRIVRKRKRIEESTEEVDIKKKKQKTSNRNLVITKITGIKKVGNKILYSVLLNGEKDSVDLHSQIVTKNVPEKVVAFLEKRLHFTDEGKLLSFNDSFQGIKKEINNLKSSISNI